MSPVPPVPIAGVPVGLIHTRPSGKAITRPLALEHQRHAVFRGEGARRADAVRWISAVVLPVRRAISPGCGVSTRTRRRGRR